MDGESEWKSVGVGGYTIRGRAVGDAAYAEVEMDEKIPEYHADGTLTDMEARCLDGTIFFDGSSNLHVNAGCLRFRDKESAVAFVTALGALYDLAKELMPDELWW